jgi:hypothetical protein
MAGLGQAQDRRRGSKLRPESYWQPRVYLSPAEFAVHSTRETSDCMAWTGFRIGVPALSRRLLKANMAGADFAMRRKTNPAHLCGHDSQTFEALEMICKCATAVPELQ